MYIPYHIRGFVNSKLERAIIVRARISLREIPIYAAKSKDICDGRKVARQLAVIITAGLRRARSPTILLQLTNIVRKPEAFNHFRAFE